MKHRLPIDGCPLTPAEIAVVRVARRLRTTSSGPIGDDLILAKRTIDRHWQDIRFTLDARCRYEVMLIVDEAGWH